MRIQGLLVYCRYKYSFDEHRYRILKHLCTFKIRNISLENLILLLLTLDLLFCIQKQYMILQTTHTSFEQVTTLMYDVDTSNTDTEKKGIPRSI